jgi:hypothetical protein
MKTKADAQGELERIKRLQDYRKLFANSQITTTHFLKKCVIMKKKQQGKSFEK